MEREIKNLQDLATALREMSANTDHRVCFIMWSDGSGRITKESAVSTYSVTGDVVFSFDPNRPSRPALSFEDGKVEPVKPPQVGFKFNGEVR